MVWGAIPDFLPEKNISWESHLGGVISGIILAFLFRKEGPQRRVYEWEDENDDENDINQGGDTFKGYSNNTDEYYGKDQQA